MNHKMDLALRELAQAMAPLQEDPKFTPLMSALQKLSEGLQPEKLTFKQKNSEVAGVNR
jgi:hypothetical protein